MRTAGACEAIGGGALEPRIGDVYDSLRGIACERALADPFTAHVFACVLAIAMREAAEMSVSVATGCGLSRSDLCMLAARWLPAAADLLDLSREPESMALDEEESQLHALLEAHAVDASQETRWLTAMTTRRSMAANHLWQDLGLSERSELTQLVRERYPALAARNVQNMKWKKFFYRSLCELEGFTLCAAPSCQECGDFDACFGEENGHSLLARARNGL